MHYFTYGQDFIAVEDAEQAAKYEAAGWQAVDAQAFSDAWKARDLAALADLRMEAIEFIERAVGDAPPALPPGYVLPAGYTLHKM